MRRYIDLEKARDLFEIDEMEAAYYDREVVTVLWSEPEDDAFDEDDPYDRLRSEGGHIGR